MVTHTRESLNVENQGVTNHVHIPCSRTPCRRYTLSLASLLLLAAFFLCTLVTVSFLVYNFGTCDRTIHAGLNENVICTTVHLKHDILKSEENITNKNNSTEFQVPHKWESVRLPRSIKPLKYNVSLVPYLYEGNFTFDGEVHIELLVLEDCYNITLHAAHLSISQDDVSVQRFNCTEDGGAAFSRDHNFTKGANNNVLRIRKQYLIEGKQFFVIELYDKLQSNTKYVMNIKFSGNIVNHLQGFYRSSYRSRNNETRWLAATQFQATDARRAFPCFDEPALKAKFSLNIARPRHLSTLSNMPKIATNKHSLIPDYEWDVFAESLPMSTYLVAYSITDFSQLTKGNFTVWARDDAIQSANYALNVGPKILKYLEEFFNIPFPLPKIDMIALPDFQAGAMENWGLITFRETAMLFEEGVFATIHKQRVASVIGHELAHQWFGNLVTPSWWSDIWLNEGFASYLEYLIVDAIEPTWNYMDQFVVNELQNVFQLDALSSSHKISVEVGDPEEIFEIFDRISYAKGSTIIRMMDHFLTSTVFRKGLNRYLKEMAFNSAEQDDLWHYLTVEAKISRLLDRNITVKDIMDTWTLQVGFPVIHINKQPYTNVIRLEQERFLYENISKGNLDSSTLEEPLWWIPITYTTAEELNFTNTRPITWMPKTKIYEIENYNLTKAVWYIFNIQVTGYYRLNYEFSNWQSITEYLMDVKAFRNIAPSNRAQLIDDSMNLARAYMLPYEIALNLSKYLQHENDQAPWRAAINAFFFLDSMFINQGEYDLLKNYLLKLLKPVYDSLGFMDPQNKSDMLQYVKRIDILYMACHIGHRNCISESIRHFQNWIQVPNPDVNNPIPPNLRSVVYCTAIQYGTELEWNFAYDRFKKTTVSSEKDILLTALGCTREPWLLFRYLRYGLSGDNDNIRRQDVLRVFAAVTSNVIGQQIAFNFVRENWAVIKMYLGTNMANLNSILKMVIQHSNSKYQIIEFESFVRKHLEDKSRVIQQIIEQVQVNIRWMSRNYKTIVDWLRQEVKTCTNVSCA